MAKKLLSESEEESFLREFGDELSCKNIFMEAINGDKVATKTVDYCMEMLGIGIANICHVVNPEAVIIGGGVAKSGQFLLDKIKPSFDKTMLYIGEGTTLRIAELGEKAGLYGAFYLIN